jgi:hypothetical protein
MHLIHCFHPKRLRKCTYTPRITLTATNKVARRDSIFKPKIPIRVNFGGSCNWRCRYILWPLGLFYCHLVYVVAVLYISWSFGIFFPVLVCCTKKNLATLATNPLIFWSSANWCKFWPPLMNFLALTPRRKAYVGLKTSLKQFVQKTFRFQTFSKHKFNTQFDARRGQCYGHDFGRFFDFFPAFFLKTNVKIIFYA